jgi:hypothetical protein
VGDLVPSADTLHVLRAAEADPHLARVISFVEGELGDRLRTDVEDEPALAVEERVVRRYRLLGRMATRYGREENQGALGQSDARLMLAVLHRLACPARLRHL